MEGFLKVIAVCVLVAVSTQTAADQQPGSYLDLSLDDLSQFDKDEANTALAIGRRKQWVLDAGEFSDDTLNMGRGFDDDPLGTYSGIRLRLPSRQH